MIPLKQTYTLSPIQSDLSILDNELKLLNPVCLDLLFKRGYTSNEAIRDILFPSFQSAIQPLACQDIKPAVEVLSKAVKEDKHIVVYRDYDVDGITAGALAVECLSALGANVHHYVNRREVDGFGICKNGIDNILKMYPDTDVIMTVDNGINGIDAIDYANSRGLTVVVTDHHEPGEKLPNAAAVVDLKRKDETYPFRDFCGCGLAFRVMLDLYRYMKKDPTPVFNTLDLVALATVADVVPLTGENRALLKDGLQRIESGDRLFFAILLPLLNVKEVNAHYTLAFQIAPILNSLSRMCEDTALAVDALLSNDPDWVLALYGGGLDVTVSLEGGEELAERTFNPRVGVVGGVSIIGTSGIVRPFSHEAFLESIRREMNVALANGCGMVVVNSGGKSEKYMKALFPGLPQQTFIHYGNAIGETMKIADECGVEHLIIGLMLGKAVKLAEGNMDTHSHKVTFNREFLKSLAEECGCSENSKEVMANLSLARELPSLLREADAERFFPELLRRCHLHCSEIFKGKLDAVLIADDGKILSKTWQ